MDCGTDKGTAVHSYVKDKGWDEMTQLPERFKERMKELLGEEYGAFEASYEKDRVQGLRLNSLKCKGGREPLWEQTGKDQAAELVQEKTGTALEPVDWVKEGFYYTGEGRPGKHPLHEAGFYYIQEPSAMAVGELLDPEPGDRVLDLCAAPGGKSSHIASRLKGDGFLLSNEIHPARARILSQNIERMGVRNGVVSNEDAGSLAVRFPEFFDKIAVDAPCSGEGMFRKDEEARNQWSEEHVRMCAARQQEILDLAASMLKPGGRIVYSTCTFAPEENEGLILHFLRKHEDFSLEPAACSGKFSQGRPEWALYGQEEAWAEEVKGELLGYGLENTIRLMPHRLEGEGHFIAILKRRPGLLAEGDRRRRTPAYLDPKRDKEYLREAERLLREVLKEPEPWLSREEYLMFGEQLYLVPPQMPDMKGLKVVRPGLHIGTWKKNRFEPAHALAAALLEEEAAGWYELPSDQEAAVRYLKGEALSCEADRLGGKEKGWVLMTAEGSGLGWAKLSGGILKNHYPKGLRWM